MDQIISKEQLNNKHIMAIDYGQKVTGIATYKVGIDPYPLVWGKVLYQDDNQLTKELISIIDDECIDYVVIGIPFFTDGKESSMTKTIKSFVTQFEKATECQIFTIDETLTTFEAEERMKQDPRYNFKVDPKKIDELCATIILEQFLKNSSD